MRLAQILSSKKIYSSQSVHLLVLSACVLCGQILGQSPGEAPLVSITSPYANQTLTEDMVSVSVRLRSDAIPSTFRAQVNGVDITSLFQETATCKQNVCDGQAYVPIEDLLHGANAISVQVEGEQRTTADDRVEVDYESPLVQTDPVSKLTPSVAVWSVRRQQDAPANDYKSYDIVVGPGTNPSAGSIQKR